MDNKEAIIQETIKLIEEKGERLDEITVREICKRASVGLGLVNYHFGNKEKLIEQCIERMINGTVEHFPNPLGTTSSGPAAAASPPSSSPAAPSGISRSSTPATSTALPWLSAGCGCSITEAA